MHGSGLDLGIVSLKVRRGLVNSGGIEAVSLGFSQGQATLRPTIFYMLTSAMVALFLLGLYFTTVDNE